MTQRTKLMVAAGAVLACVCTVAFLKVMGGSTDKWRPSWEVQHERDRQPVGPRHEHRFRNEPVGGSPGGSIAPVAADSAATSIAWVAPGETSAELRRYLDGSAYTLERLILGDYENYQAFDVWDQTVAGGDDEFSNAVRGCVAKHEPGLKAPCIWYHGIVVRGADDGRGRIAMIDTIFDRGRPRPSRVCIEYAECVRDAWAAKPVPPLPPEAAEVLSFTATGTPITPTALGIEAEQHKSWYAEQISELEQQIEQAEGVLAKRGNAPSIRHNIKLDRALLEHFQALAEQFSHG